MAFPLQRLQPFSFAGEDDSEMRRLCPGKAQNAQSPRTPRGIGWQALVLPASNRPLLLAFMTVDQFVEAYSPGGNLLMAAGRPEDGESVLAAGNSIRLIEMPASDVETPLCLRIYAQTGSASLRGEALLGRHLDVLIALMKQDLPRAVLASVLLLGGLIALGLSFTDRSLLYWGAFLVSFGVWLGSQTLVKEWFLPYPVFWRGLDLFALFQWPAWIYVFTERPFGAGPRSLIRRCWQYHAILAVAAWTIIPLHVVRFAWILLFFQISAVAVLAVFSGILIYLNWRGDLEARTFLIAACVMIFAAGHDLLAASGVLSWSMPLSLWGILPIAGWATLVPLRRHAARRHFAEDTAIQQRNVPGLAVVLQTKYNLTVTEVRICLAIHQGRHRSDIIRSFSLKEATLKAHLSNIFRKTIDRGLDDPSPGRDKVYRLAAFLRHAAAT